MVPVTALVIPTFMLLASWADQHHWAVILPSLLNPFGVYLMRVYAEDAVPDELLDAARIDGAGELKTFAQCLAAAAAGHRHGAPAVYRRHLEQLLPAARGAHRHRAPADHRRPEALAGTVHAGAGGDQVWNLIVTGALISIIPLILSFLVLQKYWQGGLTIGSLK